MNADIRNHLTLCAEGEGGRARLCMEGYGNADTAAYFAREAAHYANLLLDERAAAQNPTTACESCDRESADYTAWPSCRSCLCETCPSCDVPAERRLSTEGKATTLCQECYQPERECDACAGQGLVSPQNGPDVVTCYECGGKGTR